MSNIICGIYKITCLINNKVYIGQSIDIKRRWKEHQYRLNSNTHENLHLQNTWNTYGKDNFNFEVLEECNKKDLNDKETFYINQYQSHDYKYGYNKTIGGKSFIYYKTDCNKIISIQDSLNLKKKMILQFDLNGNLIKEWESVNSIFKENQNWSQTPLRRCLRMEKGFYTYKKCFWFYKEGYTQEKLLNLMRLKQESENQKTAINCTVYSKFLTKLNKDRGIRVNQYDREWNLIKTWESICELERSGFKRYFINKSINNLELYNNYYFKLAS